MRKKKIILTILCIIIMTICSTNCVIGATKYVATISGKSYTSLSKAIKAVKNGQTITVFNDLKTSNTVKINKPGKSFTINFAGNDYKYTGKNSAFDILAGNVTIKNGSITSKNYVFYVREKSKLVVKKGKYIGYHYNKGIYNISDGNFSTKGVSSSVDDELIQNYGTMTISKGTFYGEDDNAIYNNGKIVIKNGTFKSSAYDKGENFYPVIMNNPKSSCTIYKGNFIGKEFCIYNRGTMKIKGGTYTANNGATVANDGTLTINDGTYNVKNKDYLVLWNYNGKVIINNGKFTGCIGNDTTSKKYITINDGKYVCKYNCIIDNYSGIVNITGGTFTTANNNTILNEKKGVLNITGGTLKCTGYYYVLSNYGKAYLKGGVFKSKNNSDSILSNGDSILQVSKNVTYTGKIVYE